MAKLYYDSNCVDAMTIEEIEQVRESALKLMSQNMHPRYHLPICDLFKAANAIMNEMKMDDNRSYSTWVERENPEVPQ